MIRVRVCFRRPTRTERALPNLGKTRFRWNAGQLLLARTLLAAEGPVTLIATGPLTNLAWVLDNFPEASSKIDKVVIMGASLLP